MEGRRVQTRAPSFPEVPVDAVLEIARSQRWQVLCGDADHWRLGVYSPPEDSAEQCAELEKHDCPELFMLLSGNVTLVLADGEGGTRLLPLEMNKPVLISTPHAGFCPDGPHTGKCLVVERDEFDTEYRTPKAW